MDPEMSAAVFEFLEAMFDSCDVTRLSAAIVALERFRGDLSAPEDVRAYFMATDGLAACECPGPHKSYCLHEMYQKACGHLSRRFWHNAFGTTPTDAFTETSSFLEEDNG